MKTTVNIFRTLLLAVLTLTFGACGEDSLLSELGLDGQTSTKVDEAGEVWNGEADTSWYQVDATEFQIATAEQLAGLAELVNAGYTFEGKTIKLTADILLNDTEGWENWNESTKGLNTWTPIGNSWDNPFTGTLDGDGHSVSGIYINSTANYQGLVGVLGSGGTLQNLGVKASYIKGGYHVGGVCGSSWGTVSNCYNTGSVTGSYAVGGVCGTNDGTVTNCYNTGSVTGSFYVGGVCGYNDATVTNCYYLDTCGAAGEGTSKNAAEFASGEVAWLLSTGKNGEIWGQNLTLDPKDTYPVLGGLKVVQNGDGYANELNQNGDDFYLISTADELRLFASMVNSGNPGISAKLTADIELNNTTGWENWGNTPPANSWTPIGNSWENQFIGTLDGDGHSVSGIYINSGTDYQGLVGVLGEGGTLQDLGVKASYIKGGYSVGGLCGFNNGGTVINCYNIGSVEGNEIVGGLCGQNYATVTNCYNTGSVTGSNQVGGLCGINGGTVTNCYYLDTCGAAGEGTSKTADEFASGEVASLLGDGWGQTIGTDDYPVLDADGKKRVYAVTLYQGSDAADARYLNSNGTFPTLTGNAATPSPLLMPTVHSRQALTSS